MNISHFILRYLGRCSEYVKVVSGHLLKQGCQAKKTLNCRLIEPLHLWFF